MYLDISLCALFFILFYCCSIFYYTYKNIDYAGNCVYQCIQDPRQYALSQMEALEAEQNHVDNRAGVVERKLRQLMETGNSRPISEKNMNLG